MKLKITDIYAPINMSDLIEIIPEGEDIVYSSLFNGTTLKSNSHYSWISHILITPNGVAFKFPNMYKRKNPLENLYYPWYSVNVSEGSLVLDVYSKITFKLMKLSNSETKDERKNRALDFLQKFKTLQINKSKDYLEELRNNPDTKKKDLKNYENYVELVIKQEERRKAKVEKKRLKEEKKKKA